MMNRIQPSYADAGEISSGSQNWLSKKRCAIGAVLAGVVLATCAACGPGSERQPAEPSPTIATESLFPTPSETAGDPLDASAFFDVHPGEVPAQFEELVGYIKPDIELFYGRAEFPEGQVRALVGIFSPDSILNDDSMIEILLMLLPDGTPTLCTNMAVLESGSTEHEPGIPMGLGNVIAERLAAEFGTGGTTGGYKSLTLTFVPSGVEGAVFQVIVDCNFGEQHVAAS